MQTMTREFQTGSFSEDKECQNRPNVGLIGTADEIQRGEIKGMKNQDIDMSLTSTLIIDKMELGLD